MTEPVSFDGDKPGGVPPFEIGGVEFHCWVATTFEGTPYVWRSRCGRLAVGKRITLRTATDHDGFQVERSFAECWARIDGRLIGRDYGGLKTAMAAAALLLARSGPARLSESKVA